ncbi:restriction endonuclease [Amycolatopsis benzoatilytica]|uniref:restriction endonuclease n=1 Tax=Amycolatopsis benzoatilytica TaxID=346045 RepID=UPI00036C066A|nr:restriction endonuclease [Amycolatopsis benzoatilytica]
MVSLESLRGYVLEEVLARLLYANGYRLLVSELQDPEALTRGAHGLLVRGRGADHQADVLGELTLPVPFSLPLRIFVEAKYREAKANLRDVRNAHGVVHDVNEQYATASAGARAIPVRRYHYRYTLFSANGFSRPAQQYALAQQISLVDLSSPAFTGLLEAANHTAHQLYELAQEVRVSPFPTGQVRTALRLALGTWTADEPQGPDSDLDLRTPARRARRASHLNAAQREPLQLPAEPLARIAANLVEQVSGNLLLGFPTAPFVLALSPDDPAALSAYVARHGPDVRVNIEFATRREVTGDWVIMPADDSRTFQLRFALPALLEDWLLRDDGAALLRARDVKADLLSSIAVFLDGRLVRLLFQPRRRG